MQTCTTVIQTPRLLIQELEIGDAAFMQELMNSPKWMKYIGDRNIYSIKDAEEHIQKSYVNNYAKSKAGFWKVILKESGTTVGTCGLIDRPSLDDLDIGFAFLPEHEGKGYAYESAKAVIEYAKTDLKMDRVVAITLESNVRSRSLLEKIGLNFEKNMTLDNGDEVMFYSWNNR